MRDHDTGATLTLNADDMDRVMEGLLSGDRDALILADALNRRWRIAVDDPRARDVATRRAEHIEHCTAPTCCLTAFGDD